MLNKNEKLYVLDYADPDNGATYVYGGWVLIGPKKFDLDRVWEHFVEEHSEDLRFDEFVEMLILNYPFRDVDVDIEYKTFDI